MAEEGAMTAIALEFPRAKTGTVRVVISRLARWRAMIVAFAIGFPIAFYLFLLGVLVVKYGHLPNYVTPYDWIHNVLRIIHHTPSVADMVPIILNEWLLEIGYMDYTYGHGVADWSLAIIPHKLAIMSLAGALVGLNVALLCERRASQSLAQESARACRSGFLTCLGGLFTGLTGATVFSVACCAVPSWAGSLTILGMETSLAFTLEPFGPVASLLGMAALIISALWLAHDSYSDSRAEPGMLQRAPSC
jgi:hypothetical protein